MDYIAYLFKETDSDFGVCFPDFPGCITAGKSLKEARDFAAEALALHISGMEAEGEVIPEPSTLDDLRHDPNSKGALICLVSAVRQSDKPVRVNITARESQIEQIDKKASQAGMTRSAYMVQSALGYGRRRKSA